MGCAEVALAPLLAAQQPGRLGRRQAGGPGEAGRRGDRLLVQVGVDVVAQPDGGQALARHRACSARFSWSSMPPALPPRAPRGHGRRRLACGNLLILTDPITMPGC
jgi:hypothetical protein